MPSHLNYLILQAKAYDTVRFFPTQIKKEPEFNYIGLKKVPNIY